jgi:hypothetical protein
MLRGLRTAVQYFTVGLALGLLLAPRRGEETRALLLDQVRTYMGDAFAGAGAARDQHHHPGDNSRAAYGSSADGDLADDTLS